ncbi:MAG: hypothetical protein NVS3B14_20820 [Ktedonobacteraceae bacterium]
MIFLFMWGRTGSGKSTSARILREMVERKGWSCQSFNDYLFLREMYKTDNANRFHATEHDGFEVLDLSVYVTAIRSLAQQIQSYQPAHERTLVTIEFTCNNYRDVLCFFDEALLHKAYFFFITADLKTCLDRVTTRTLHPTTQDDYFVPDSVLLQHYPSPYMPPYISKEKARLIPNMGTLDELRWHLQAEISGILGREGPVEQIAELVGAR